LGSILKQIPDLEVDDIQPAHLCGCKYQVRELVPNRPGALVGQLPELVVTSSEEYWNW
jgi:hypothetical protein